MSSGNKPLDEPMMTKIYVGMRRHYAAMSQTKAKYDKVWHMCILIEMWHKWRFVYWVWYNDVIKWKHFPRYWPLVRRIHRSPVNSLHKGQWRGALVFSSICALNKRLSKRWWGWWLETPSCPLWRHCNDINGCIEQTPRYAWLIRLNRPVFQHVAGICRSYKPW